MKRSLCLTILAVFSLASAAPRLAAQEQAREPEPSARTAPLAGRTPLIFASPVNGGC
jgi:hypothetical protein